MLMLISQLSPSKKIEFQTNVCACVLNGLQGVNQGGQKMVNVSNRDLRRHGECVRHWTKTTKRRRCMVCGKFGHDSECCWLLEKSEDTQQVVVNTCRIQFKQILTMMERRRLFSCLIENVFVLDINLHLVTLYPPSYFVPLFSNSWFISANNLSPLGPLCPCGNTLS